MRRLLVATVVCLSLFVIAVHGQQVDGPLTNASVAKLVKAGFKEKTIITLIGNRANEFKLGTDDLITLKHSGVTENIILAMLSAQLGTHISTEDEWAGDLFFKDSKKSGNGEPSQSQGENIFGSGSSSQSQTRSRNGVIGGDQNDGNVSGSATVRIIKPQTEGGAGATPKLDKTPTLTNEGVVRLVEAGFSEGTIIKRIEASPVDFDLSPARIAELQKRRVTDAIIAAMTAAMGDK